MNSSFARHLDAFAVWRQSLERQLAQLAQALRASGLLDAETGDVLDRLRRQLASERVVLAFVAEFSRGKTELINAIFFADTGRRILPASPGRTTMCPVEIGCQRGDPAMLALLPIHTRTLPDSIDELRRRPELWTRIPLDTGSPDRLADSLTELMRTKAVTVEEARSLGLWDDERPQDNPPPAGDGLVEVPSWRHAVVNYPHPLLERGLVVLDTPGLNAIGTEAALTLSMLPAAHAIVFVAAADVGVTKSDLAIWRDQLDGQTAVRYAVLNKVDMLDDPLLSRDEVESLVEAQRAATAATLELDPSRVFALSARRALVARIDGQRAALAESRLPAFEQVLASELLPRRREALVAAVLDGVGVLEQRLQRLLVDQRRQTAEQLLELRGLRGKSQAKVRLILQRLGADARDFERSTVRLTAMRAVHSKMLREALAGLSIDRLRIDVERMQHDIAASPLRLGARRLLGELCQRWRQRLRAAAQRNDEIREMLQASFSQLNSEFGFALAVPQPPSIERALKDLMDVERHFGSHLGVVSALRLTDARHLEQFRRLLWSRLRAVVEGAIAELELWSRDASAQVDAQLRERRQNFARRQTALERIQAAAGELEQRIAEVEAQDERQRAQATHVEGLFAAARRQAGQVSDPDATLRPFRPEPPTLTQVAPRARAATA